MAAPKGSVTTKGLPRLVGRAQEQPHHCLHGGGVGGALDRLGEVDRLVEVVLFRVRQDVRGPTPARRRVGGAIEEGPDAE